MLKSIYRKEPIISFVVTAGAVDAAMGGFTEHWSLMGLGIGAVGVAIVLRLRQMQTRRSSKEPQNRPPVYVLPPAPSSLPLLTVPKKNSPGR